MLRGPGHDHSALREASRRAEEGEVDGFGAGRGERDLGAIGAQRLGGYVACMVQRGAGASSFCVRARRIAGGDAAQRVGDCAEDRR